MVFQINLQFTFHDNNDTKFHLLTDDKTALFNDENVCTEWLENFLFTREKNPLRFNKLGYYLVLMGWEKTSHLEKTNCFSNFFYK